MNPFKLYFHKYKRDMFPEITDWKDSHDNIRYEKDVAKIPLKKWLFFHPTAYLIASYGTNAMTIIMFGGLSILSFFKGWHLFTLLGGVVAVFAIPALITNIKNYGIIKHTTFYDLWMREGLE